MVLCKQVQKVLKFCHCLKENTFKMNYTVEELSEASNHWLIWIWKQNRNGTLRMMQLINIQHTCYVKHFELTKDVTWQKLRLGRFRGSLAAPGNDYRLTFFSEIPWVSVFLWDSCGMEVKVTAHHVTGMGQKKRQWDGNRDNCRYGFLHRT